MEDRPSGDGGYGYAAFMVAMGTLDALVKARTLPLQERKRIIAITLALLRGPEHAQAREMVRRFRRTWRAQEKFLPKVH